MSTPPITLTHLAKLALIYVRQSTLKQIQQHPSSAARQYDLTARAQALGWSPTQIIVIDQDQAQSGARSDQRTGFQWLVAEVGLGHAGAVFSLEASRLARASSDWHRLLELCALTQTLVVDEEGIYDPQQYNDRLLLGFKGTLSEAELHWLQQRLTGGRLELARQGRLRQHLPTGYGYDELGRIQKDPDEAVQASLTQVFEVFARESNARAVVRHFQQQGLLIPVRRWSRACQWKPLTPDRVLGILHNPTYAGVFVYGQKRYVAGKGQRVSAEEWAIVLPEHHPGYLSWEQFQANQRQLRDNQPNFRRPQRGAIRDGVGLLQGIVLCGHCGRRMKVTYQEDRQRPLYLCSGTNQATFDQRCQAIRGHHIDATVTELVLAAIQPAQVQATLATLAQFQQQVQGVQQQRQWQVEQAQYEADLAERRYQAVDPQNRLVARTLERDWEAKLQQVAALQREQARQPLPQPPTWSALEQGEILTQLQQLPHLWSAPTTTHSDRKQLVRALIQDVTLKGSLLTIQIGVRWLSGATTVCEIPRGTLQTAPQIIQRIRELMLAQYSDAAIAEQLTAQGWVTARRHPFTAARVKELRSQYHLSRTPGRLPLVPPTEETWYPVRQASELLGWGISTLHKWCHQGRLEYRQTQPNAPLWIKLSPELLVQWRKPIAQVS